MKRSSFGMHPSPYFGKSFKFIRRPRAGNSIRHKLKNSNFVQNIIEKGGYILPFFYQVSHLFTQEIFYFRGITKLLNSNYINELDQAPYCCSPLTMVQGKNFRLVLDLCHVNKFLKQSKFCYENLNTLSEMISTKNFVDNL